jgi:hypothetical protein
MRKATYTVIIFLLSVLSFVSCQKEYHCACTFNNAVVYNVDLGVQYKNNATNQCSSYDTIVVGEIWNCTIY